MQKIISVIMRMLLFALPLFFLPITTEFYDFNKQTLFAVVLVVILVLLLITYLQRKSIDFTVSPLTLPVMIFVIAALATFFINAPNKVESLIYPNGTGTIVLLAIWFVLVVNLVDLNKVYAYLNPLLLSGVILSVLTILQYFKIGANLFVPKNHWMSSPFWNPTGSPLILAIFLAAILPYGIIRLLQYARHARPTREDNTPAHQNRMIAFGVASGVITLTLALLIVSLFTNAKPVLLPFPFGWAIAAEVMKGLQTAALGVGLLNFLPAFTTGHTAAYNALPIWNVRFGVSSNYYLQLVTELGIIGLIAYIVIVLRFLKRFLTYVKGLMAKTLPYNSLFLAVSIGILIIFITQLFVPGNLLQMIVLFTFLGIFGKYISTKTYTERSSVLFYLILAASVISIFIVSVTIYRAYAAEVYLKASLDAAQKKNTEGMYRSQQSAIRSNPFVDKFHAMFAQTNLAFAIALAQKKDITDADRTTLAQLLAQAAQSGKNAIVVGPTNVNNWENLGNIYRAMIGAVQNADVWTVQSYSQAARLDPANPNIFLALGGVYYSAKNYDAAVQNFMQAARLKPNFANAYYNLSAAYREKKDWNNAAAAMQATIANLPRDSADRKKAEQELEEIKKNIPPQQDASSSGQLRNEGQSQQQITTPVDLPENAAPNDVISPTTAPTATPSSR